MKHITLIIVTAITLAAPASAQAEILLTIPSVDRNEYSDAQLIEADAAKRLSNECPLIAKTPIMSATCIAAFGKDIKRIERISKCGLKKHGKKLCKQLLTGEPKRGYCAKLYRHINIDKFISCKKRKKISRTIVVPTNMQSMSDLRDKIYAEMKPRNMVAQCGKLFVRDVDCNEGLAIAVQAYNSYTQSGVPTANGWDCIKPYTHISYTAPSGEQIGHTSVLCTSGNAVVLFGETSSTLSTQNDRYNLPEYEGVETFIGYSELI